MADLLNTNPNDNYGDDAIVTLSPREHIRLRPGMYIGKLGDGAQADDGIYVLIKEVVDNSVDEFIMGVGRQIDISIADNVVSVRDYGRGIPLKSLAAAVSEMNTSLASWRSLAVSSGAASALAGAWVAALTRSATVSLASPRHIVTPSLRV